MTKIDALKAQFFLALDRFSDVLKQPQNDYMRDAAIQRFEFTFDLAWKLIKAALEEQAGVVCTSPKDCFRQAYK